jgi:hypothetical protein
MSKVIQKISAFAVDISKLISVSEYAKQQGTSPQNINHRIKQGYLKAYKIGNVLAIDTTVGDTTVTRKKRAAKPKKGRKSVKTRKRNARRKV